MQTASIKIFAIIIASIMSFLGWQPNDYAIYLPKQIQSEIEIKETPLKQSTEPKVAPKPIAKKVETPATKPKTPPQTTQVAPQIPKAVTPPQPKQIEIRPVETTPTPIPKSLTKEQRIRESVVNILCTMQTGSQIAYHTGSAVMIDESGILITNAHVAEHIMLDQVGRESCFIRTGSPASNSYKAKIIFMPDTWIENNPSNLSSSVLVGTGENDYAFLMLVSRVSKNAPDVPLTKLDINSSSLSQGSLVTIAGYPLLSQSISMLNTGLYSVIETSSINKVGGYDGNSFDVINTAPTSIAVQGVSGGAIVDTDGKLVALIDSAVSDPYSGKNAIQAITFSYIERSLASKGKSIKSIIDNAQTESSYFSQNKLNYLSSLL